MKKSSSVKKSGSAKAKAKPAAKAKSARKAPTKVSSKAPAKAVPKTKAAAAKAAGKKAAPTKGRPGLRFGSQSTISPLSLTPPPPPPPKKSPSRGKGITIIEPKRQAMKAAQEAEKASKGSRRGSHKIDLANARSVAAVAIGIKADQHGYVIVNGRRVRMISTKLVKPKKKKSKAAAAAAAAAARAAPSDATPQMAKSKLSPADLARYRETLLQHRRELVGRVTGLEDEALRSNGGNLSHMPLHPADIGTDTFDQDFALGMAATDRQLLQELDDALDRIVKRTYGVCLMTGKPIPKARLDAKPWAKYTVEAARLVESGQAR